ncbi:hypothetical protein [Nonomuraea cavernae]|uniref:hypothetical protein n=1 Tax=Nonomuraea cavernae TaxID=2045107 RepID=UPI0033DE2186
MIDQSLQAGDVRRHRALRALFTAGPPAAAFTAYGVLIDHLPDTWFTVDVLRYLLALLAAGCVWLGLAALRRLPAVAALTSGSTALAPDVPAQVERAPTGKANTVTGPPARVLVVGARRRLIETAREAPGHPGLFGWCQFLGESLPPSATGTSYGLRLVLAMDLHHPTLDRRMLVRTLLALQCGGGGWAARSQRGIGRPEVTAWALGAASRAGLDPVEQARLVGLLEEITERDTVGLERTTVVTTVVSTLAEIAPASPLLPHLADRLIASATHARDEVGWGERLVGEPPPSVAHTARAIVALRRAADVLPGHGDLDESVQAGLSWLVKGGSDLADSHERLRRPVGTELDTITIHHFTAAWVAKALMACGDPDPDLLRGAVEAVLRRQENGIWRWKEWRPIWMTYQGLSVMRDYAMRRPIWM